MFTRKRSRRPFSKRVCWDKNYRRQNLKKIPDLPKYTMEDQISRSKESKPSLLNGNIDLPVAGFNQHQLGSQVTDQEEKGEEMEIDETSTIKNIFCSDSFEAKQLQQDIEGTEVEIHYCGAERAPLIAAQEKLADSERKLADEMQTRMEKRIMFKGIIDEEESQLKILTKEIQSVQDAINLKELKIREMKRKRKEVPFLKKFGIQISISKSVLKKERMEDDLSVLKSRSAARRRKIQKYKTKIRYDLQILCDSNGANYVDSPRVTKPKTNTSRPIPACFFVGNSSHFSEPECIVQNPADFLVPKTQMMKPSISGTHSNQPLTAISNCHTQTTSIPPKKECFVESKWALSSIDTEEVSTLLRKQLRVGEIGEPSSARARSSSSENRKGPLKMHEEKELSKSPSTAISNSSISLDVTTIL